jgi:hypothetical protein
MYFDGLLVSRNNISTVDVPGSVSSDEELNCVTGQRTMEIGCWGSGPRPFNGSLDEIRIYNRSLSPSEVLQLNNTFGITMDRQN